MHVPPRHIACHQGIAREQRPAPYKTNTPAAPRLRPASRRYGSMTTPEQLEKDIVALLG